MTPDDWFDVLRGKLPAGAPATTDAEIEALLDLARIAAHTSERWTAPVTTFMLGVALAEVDPMQRARRVRELAADLEAHVEDLDT